MGIFDELIKQEQNKPDPEELERIRKQEEKEAEQRAYAEAEEKLMPYVRTALLEYPDACRKMGCENLIVFVYKKPGFFRNNGYEKWTGIPVYQKTQRFGRPVPVAVSTVRLVEAAEFYLRGHLVLTVFLLS